MFNFHITFSGHNSMKEIYIFPERDIKGVIRLFGIKNKFSLLIGDNRSTRGPRIVNETLKMRFN